MKQYDGPTCSVGTQILEDLVDVTSVIVDQSGVQCVFGSSSQGEPPFAAEVAAQSPSSGAKDVSKPKYRRFEVGPGGIYRTIYKAGRSGRSYSNNLTIKSRVDPFEDKGQSLKIMTSACQSTREMIGHPGSQEQNQTRRSNQGPTLKVSVSGRRDNLGESGECLPTSQFDQIGSQVKVWNSEQMGDSRLGKKCGSKSHLSACHEALLELPNSKKIGQVATKIPYQQSAGLPLSSDEVHSVRSLINGYEKAITDKIGKPGNHNKTPNQVKNEGENQIKICTTINAKEEDKHTIKSAASTTVPKCAQRSGIFSEKSWTFRFLACCLWPAPIEEINRPSSKNKRKRSRTSISRNIQRSTSKIRPTTDTSSHARKQWTKSKGKSDSRCLSQRRCGFLVPQTSSICHLNVNSNAGNPDINAEPGKIEPDHASCTSVHSSDQFFSLHTDTPDGKNLDSDPEVSPSMSFDEEAAEKPGGLVLSDQSETHSSKSCEAIKLSSEKIVAAPSQTSQLDQEKRAEKSGENLNVAEESKCEQLPAATNQVTSSTAQDGDSSGKNKKKGRTAETALYIKFESSMSKRVTTTTTTTVKEKGKPGNRSRPDVQKPLAALEDQHKNAALCAPVAATADKENRVLAAEAGPRHTKIVRYSDCFSGTLEADASGEEAASRNQLSSVLKGLSSETRGSQIKTLAASAGKADNQTLIKNSHPFSPQKSPKSRSPSSSLERKQDALDSDYASERESSVATIIVNVTKMSPIREAVKETNQLTRKNNDTSAKAKIMDSPRREQRSQNDRRDYSRTPVMIADKKVVSSGKIVDESEQIKPVMKSISLGGGSAAAPEPAPRKKSIPHLKVDSPSKRSQSDTSGKQLQKKPSAKPPASTEKASQKEKASEPETKKTKVHLLSNSLRKRSPGKALSRSPEPRKRKRLARKSLDARSSASADSSKAEKPKRMKVLDKIADKKKKKKKPKTKGSVRTSSRDSSEAETLSSKGPDKKAASLSSSKNRISESTTPGKKFSFSPTPQFMETTTTTTTTTEQRLSPVNHWSDKCNQQTAEEAEVGKDPPFRPPEKDNLVSKPLTHKSRATSSADNISMSVGAMKPVRATESVPTFTGTVYTSITKVVQVAPCPKAKKQEKDLHQAEQGWNSGTMSGQEKLAADRAKLGAKKMKAARYYLVKPKLKSSTTVAANTQRLKLPPPTPSSRLSEGDSSLSGDVDRIDTTQADSKAKPVQPKCVQFSESTEKQASFKFGATDCKTVSPSKSAENSNIPILIGKSISELVKPLLKPDLEQTIKLAVAKKDDSRFQTTPPRKKQVLWQKKPIKPALDASVGAVKSCGAVVTKSAPAPTLLKQPRQPSENALKSQSSRQLLAQGSSLKAKPDSPHSSLTSVEDKGVAYNTWITSNALPLPMNKAHIRLVAKTGSPVDIREIIEGSSVDAPKQPQRMLHGVRAAKSVSSLGSHRFTSEEIGKRPKLPGEPRTAVQKRSKDGRLRESLSARSLSSPNIADNRTSASVRLRSVFFGTSVSPIFSSAVDSVALLRQQSPSGRSVDPPSFNKKKKKSPKKLLKDGSSNAQSMRSLSDISQIQDYGDLTEYSGPGLSWVQSVFNILPFINHKLQPSAANPSGDTTSEQRDNLSDYSL